MQETTTGNLRAKSRQFGFHEGGLVLVVLVLGMVLAFFGGSVERPKFRVNEQGERERVFRELPNGEREPVLERKNKLRGIEMSSPDIRAGVALLIAALSAEGKSVIQNIDQIDRGYQYIDKRLQQLGADIRRV